jgi:hypothetical protein
MCSVHISLIGCTYLKSDGDRSLRTMGTCSRGVEIEGCHSGELLVLGFVLLMKHVSDEVYRCFHS